MSRARPLVARSTLAGRVLLLAFFTNMAVFGGGGLALPAQGSALWWNDSWMEPLNLSQSGAGISPQIVIDSSGMLHAAWIDVFAGYVVSESRDAKTWSEPVAAGFPFGSQDTLPLLVPDGGGNIHAFWMDSEKNLFHSYAPSDRLATRSAWEVVTRVADAVAAFDAAVDSAGALHLVYVDLGADSAPAGVYYRRSRDAGTSWSPAASIYLSPYLRAVSSGQSHVRVSVTTDDSTVYALWDNQPLKRVFFATLRSDSNEWLDPVVLRQPDDGSERGIPAAGDITAQGDHVLVTWQSSTTNCTVYSQWSGDQGRSWSPEAVAVSAPAGCPHANRLTLTQDGLVVLVASFDDQTLLTAWDWDRTEWGRVSTVPASFINPDTFEPIRLGCQHVAVGVEGKQYVVGCDQGGGGDIWMSWRSPLTRDDWFPSPSYWSAPSLALETHSAVADLVLLADAREAFHVLWSQPNPASRNTSAIYHSAWTGESWAPSTAVLEAVEGEINHLHAAVAGPYLLVSWSDGVSGQIFFSWANAERAASPAEWARPKPVVSNQAAAGYPHLSVDEVGTISIIYAVSVNENRGVYLTWSDDVLGDWSAPATVFDAATAGWSMVGSPYQVGAQRAHLNAIWMKLPLPTSRGPIGLFASRSSDGGLDWAPPVEVAEADITWATVQQTSGNILHRLWQEVQGNERIVWHQYSSDEGDSWTRPASITGLAAYVGPPAVAVDMAGRLHLFQVKADDTNRMQVMYWLWSEGGWSGRDSLMVGSSRRWADGRTFVTAAVSPGGRVLLMYPDLTDTEEALGESVEMLYAFQSVDMPPVSATAVNELAPTGTAPTPPASTPEVSPLPEVSPSPTAVSNAGSTSADNSPWRGALLGGGLVTGLLGVVVAIRLLAGRSR